MLGNGKQADLDKLKGESGILSPENSKENPGNLCYRDWMKSIIYNVIPPSITISVPVT
ncbi:hypothetical protein HNP24_001697 [Chryseobacterium sediminis]|uniref:Uncharacterized protein n=1 Tax=Chryseobacterium sediminis TaxID=1679494 RepID=A0ABR6PYJ4_9FLAO|nr:hypothetical protein [Chryseobacterium sediminis]